MNITDFDTTTNGQNNARAEDGFTEPTRWNAFCEGILIPLSAIVAVCLAITGTMLIAR
jgi:hypothetical protein